MLLTRTIYSLRALANRVGRAAAAASLSAQPLPWFGRPYGLQKNIGAVHCLPNRLWGRTQRTGVAYTRQHRPAADAPAVLHSPPAGLSRHGLCGYCGRRRPSPGHNAQPFHPYVADRRHAGHLVWPRSACRAAARRRSLQQLLFGGQSHLDAGWHAMWHGLGDVLRRTDTRTQPPSTSGRIHVYQLSL